MLIAYFSDLNWEKINRGQIVVCSAFFRPKHNLQSMTEQFTRGQSPLCTSKRRLVNLRFHNRFTSECGAIKCLKLRDDNSCVLNLSNDSRQAGILSAEWIKRNKSSSICTNFCAQSERRVQGDRS